eukprot:scaffold33025_cov73-Cyclotella_meneghiniana.AAC.3
MMCTPMVGWAETKETSPEETAPILSKIQLQRQRSYRDNPPPPPPRSDRNRQKYSPLFPPPPPPRPPPLRSNIIAKQSSSIDSINLHRKRLSLSKSLTSTDSTPADRQHKCVTFEDDLLGSKDLTIRNPIDRRHTCVTFEDDLISDMKNLIIRTSSTDSFVPVSDAKSMSTSASSTTYAMVKKPMKPIPKSFSDSNSRHRLQPKSVHSSSFSQSGNLNAIQSRPPVEFDAVHNKEWHDIIAAIQVPKKKGSEYTLSSSMPNILSNHQPKPRTTLSSSLRSNLDVSLESLLYDEDKNTEDYGSDLSASSNTAVDGSAPPSITRLDGLGEAHPMPIYSSYEHRETGRAKSKHSKQHQSQGHRIRAVSSSAKDNLTKNNTLSTKRLVQKAKEKRSSKQKFDKNGRCKRHPMIVVASKRPFANGWNMILDCCPVCVEESDRKAVARAA